jgi:hypothetical protein
MEELSKGLAAWIAEEEAKLVAEITAEINYNTTTTILLSTQPSPNPKARASWADALTDEAVYPSRAQPYAMAMNHTAQEHDSVRTTRVHFLSFANSYLYARCQAV